MTNEELKNMLFIIDTLLDDAITDSTRQKVKDKLTEVCQLAINALDQRWIPVSERLPETRGQYLVTIRRGVYDGEKESIEIINYSKRSAIWEYCVTAWMPLPEPYKEDAE